MQADQLKRLDSMIPDGTMTMDVLDVETYDNWKDDEPMAMVCDLFGDEVSVGVGAHSSQCT